MPGLFLGAWRYRFFILSSIRNELKASFVRSRLGGLWVVLRPLMQVLMYALILSALLSAKLPGVANSRFSYAIYLTAGILSWTLFSEVVLRCLTIFIDNANLMKKMLFPRICLPLIVCGSALLNNAILLTVIVLIFTFAGHYPSLQILWMPFIMAITMALGLGIGLTLGVLNVFIRDIGQIVPILLQFGFWFTPIVYPVSIIPDPYRGWLAFSPVYHVVTATQSILVFRSPPGWTGLLVTGGACIVLLGFALWLFRRASPEMVDVL